MSRGVEIKVPEGVLMRYRLEITLGKSDLKALTAALEQLVEEVLGDEAIKAAWSARETRAGRSWKQNFEPSLRAALQHVLGGSE